MLASTMTDVLATALLHAGQLLIVKQRVAIQFPDLLTDMSGWSDRRDYTSNE